MNTSAKLIFALSIVGLVGWVLFDTDTAIGLQATYLVGWCLSWIPGRVWLAIGEAFAEMMPWIMISTL
jgi:hypothetical protein